MADVNIANCRANPRKKKVRQNALVVTFHAGDASYTLYFRNPNTFGIPSAIIPQGGIPTPLLILQAESTGYCISGPGCPTSPPCPPAEIKVNGDGDPFEIIITSDFHKRSHSKPKPKMKRAAVKAKPKSSARTAAKKKPTAKAKTKPKAKPKAKAKAKKKR